MEKFKRISDSRLTVGQKIFYIKLRSDILITGETAVESLAGYAWNGKLEKHDKNSVFAYRTVETDRTFTYDDAGRLLFVTETESGCGICVYTYEYDLMGNNSSALSAISRLGQ